jgi:hypothetical protein
MNGGSMPLNLSRGEIHRLARVGAQARLQELERERALILKAFPGLEAGVPGNLAVPAEGGRLRRRRRTMSAAERKAVSVRMRKYWAARRREKAAR